MAAKATVLTACMVLALGAEVYAQPAPTSAGIPQNTIDLVIQMPATSKILNRLDQAAKANDAVVKKVFNKTNTQVWTLQTDKFKSFIEAVNKADQDDPTKRAIHTIDLLDGGLHNLFTAYPAPLLTKDQQGQLERLHTKSALNVYVSRVRRDNLTAQLMSFQDVAPATPQTPIDLNVIPGQPITARPLTTKKSADGASLWTAELRRPSSMGASKDDRGFASLTLRNNDVSGVVVIGGDVYSVHPLSDGAFAIVERDRGGLDHPEQKPTRPKPSADDEVGAMDQEPSPVRLMVLYTDKAAAESKAIVDDITNVVALTNQSFSQSGISNATIALVLTERTSLVETGDIVADTRKLMNRVNNAADVLYAHRKNSNANVVMLVASYEYKVKPCGWSPMIKADARHAVSTVSYECLFTNFSMAHELGHIFGARHDKGDDPDEPYSYGHGYTNVDHWRTIMAYPTHCAEGKCPRILYWATPNVSHPVDNVPLGTVDSEYDAKVIREQAPRVSHLRSW